MAPKLEMSFTAKWTDTEGLNTLKQIISRRVPQWPNGLRDFQLENIPRVLDGENLLVFTATGDGKSSFYDVPVLVHMELAANPQLYAPFPIRETPVAIVVTPTKGLANSIILEARGFGLSGLSYCHETLVKYSAQDLPGLICKCTEWQIICVDPEHLATKEWARILQNETFLKNLVLFCVEEAHLIRSWSPNFRPQFEFIGATARGFIPEHVSIVALTATCAPGPHTLAISQSLGMFGSSYHLIRRSNERINMQLIVDPLKREKAVPKFAKILDYLRDGRKTVIHVKTIPDAYDIYEFLWRHIPPGINRLRRMRMYHSLCTDDYNRNTFERIDNDPLLQVVIVTVAFMVGINCKRLLDSISYNFPLTIDDFMQMMGRAGRAEDVTCRGIAIVPEKLVQQAKDFMHTYLEIQPRASKTAIKNKSRKKKEDSEEMDMGKASFLAEEICLTGNINDHFSNPPVETSRLDCREADCKVYCALCAKRYSISYTFKASDSESSFPWLPLIILSPLKSTTPCKSKTSLGKAERLKMRNWLEAFRQLVHSEFEPFTPILSHYPIAWFLSDAIIDDVLDNFLKIKVLEDLHVLLERHAWKYIEAKGDMLLRLIIDFQEKIYEWRSEDAEAKTKNRPKKQVSKGSRKKKQIVESDSEPEMEYESGLSGEENQDMEEGLMAIPITIQPIPSNSTRPRKPRKPLQTMNEVAAEYGPIRTKRR
ncbi:hypothetical protein D9758_015511 [Tetrapyrgos nigripes]|uniref:DNA 3'-5' helicase n=1 Tax=Tetrapyrgos nigripes TaxID=182062 RepID=A0A8H5CWT5_9AGAR|nr:hypothetical protein D9758_015511 [Tetrapyrgos nigripes]